MPIIQKKDATETGDSVDIEMGIMMLWDDVKECGLAVEQSYAAYEWFLTRFMQTASSRKLYKIVPADEHNPPLLKLITPASSSLHWQFLDVFMIDTANGRFGMPGIQILLATAFMLNPKLAELLVEHVQGLGSDSGPMPLPISVLPQLKLRNARESMAVGTYLLLWPSGKITIGKASLSFKSRLSGARYCLASAYKAKDDRAGRHDFILFDVSRLSMTVFGWGSPIAFALETVGICIFDSTNPNVGMNTNKVDASDPKMCLADSLFPQVWGRILELSKRGIYMPRMRREERESKASDRFKFVNIPGTFAHFRTAHLKDVWPASTGDFYFYQYLTAIIMLTHHGKYTRFPPLPLHAQTRHKGWRPPLPGQSLSALVNKIAIKLDRLEGRQIYGSKRVSADESCLEEFDEEDEIMDEDIDFEVCDDEEEEERFGEASGSGLQDADMDWE